MLDYNDHGVEIAARVERFVRETVVPFERDPRRTSHGPSDELVQELRHLARQASVLSPHIGTDGGHLTHRATAKVLRAAGLSPLGPLAVNVMAPDEGNMYLLGKVASAEQKTRFLAPLVSGAVRSAFFMTEPAIDDGAGSDPSMMLTTARRDGNHWVVDGRKAFITGAEGATVGFRHGESRRRRDDVPYGLARSARPDRATARYDRLIDAGRSRGGKNRWATRSCGPNSGIAR